MKPVTQTLFGDEGELGTGQRGNCMQAAVASMLELPLNEVPHFADDPGEWWTNMQEWFREMLGCVLISVKAENIQSVAPYMRPGVFCFISGISPRGLDHSIVGQLRQVGLNQWEILAVHDPHPSQSGLTEIMEYRFLVVVDPSKSLAKRGEAQPQ